MLGLGLIGKVADLAGAVIDSKAVVKKAEAETKMKLATGEISWEQAAIIAIVACSFVPPLQPYMKEGFANLEAAPQWFQWSLYASIAASFGIRTMKGFKK
jgi:hypothetical protein